MPDEQRSRQRVFLTRWAEAIASVMGTISGSSWTIDAVELPCQGSPTDGIEERFQFAGPLAGSLAFSVERAEALRLVSLFVAEENKDWGQEQKEALDELSRQFAGELATRIKPELGEVEVRLQPDDEPNLHSWNAQLQLSVPGADPVHVWIALDNALGTALSEPVIAAKATCAEISSNNLDLLMQVPLAVTLRFGQREMLLQEILDLQSGSVVELDRNIDEPVDLLLNNRIIARGVVVVIDGNLGLRVSEVGSVMRQA